MSDAHVPIDLLWCRLLEQRQRGLMCDPRRLDACIARYGGACAVSFITPAVVEQLCAEYDTVDEFLVGLNTLTPNQY